MIDVSCNRTSVNVRNEHIYHNNSHIQVYNANYNNNNINDSIYMHYVIAL